LTGKEACVTRAVSEVRPAAPADQPGHNVRCHVLSATHLSGARSHGAGNDDGPVFSLQLCVLYPLSPWLPWLVTMQAESWLVNDLLLLVLNLFVGFSRVTVVFI